MAMRIFARIENETVQELLQTEHDVRTLFHPALSWMDVTDVTGIASSWRYAAGAFSAPPRNEPPQQPSLADLQARLAELQQQIAAAAH